MVDWHTIGNELKSKMAEREPEIKVRDVMAWFNLSSTSHAEYYLDRLHEMGIVKRVKGDKYSRWFLAW